MGCGASVAKDATAEQKEKMCSEACKNMMVICVEHVINVEVIQNKSKDIQIEAPGQQVKQIKEFVLSLRQAAQDAKASGEKTAKDAEAKAAEAGASAGGMMSGLGLGGAGAALAGAATAGAALAGQGAAAVAGAAGSGADTVFTAAADALQGQIDAVEAEFSGVAQELVAAKKVEIFDIYNKIIAACAFQSATGLVRGAAPHTATEYAAVKPGTIGLAFNNASAKQLEEALLPAVQEEINKSKVVKAWDASIEKYNSGNEALSKNELLAKFKSEPIKLDINTYIVAEVVKKLGVLMGKREDEVRKAPQNMAQRQPRTFEKCFSGDRLTENEFKDFEAGK